MSTMANSDGIPDSIEDLTIEQLHLLLVRLDMQIASKSKQDHHLENECTIQLWHMFILQRRTRKAYDELLKLQEIMQNFPSQRQKGEDDRARLFKTPPSSPSK